MGYIIEIVEDAEIKEGVYIRQLELQYDRQSDYLMTTSAFSGIPINHLKWIPVECFFGVVWKGKRLKEWQKKNGFSWEFAIGEIPESHIQRKGYPVWHGKE
jgi:hypothetical protein